MSSTIRLQLEVLHGPVQGHRVIVSPDIPLIVGRAAGVGLVIPDDPTVSRQHFQISWAPPDWQLKSLSNNGTWVNKEEVTEINLIDNDEIRIGGDSIFRVHLLSDYSFDARPKVVTKLPPGASPEPPTYCATTCSSGLTRYTCGDEICTPAELVQQLAGKGSIYAMIDFRRLGAPPPESLTHDAVLFDWLPHDISRDNSPLFMSAASPEFLPLLESGWGKDAMVLLQSHSAPEVVYSHLKSALKFNAQGKPSTGTSGFLGICWPGILESLLSNGSAGLIENLMQPIDAVLLESHESAARWQILAQPNFAETLKELGWKPNRMTLAGLKSRKSK